MAWSPQVAPAAEDSAALLPADHVVVVTVPADSGLDFAIVCEAGGWQAGNSFSDALVGLGAVYSDATGRTMDAFMFHVGDPHTSRGSALEAEGIQVVADIEADPRRGVSWFLLGVGFFGYSTSGLTDLHITVAVWGAEPICEASYGGSDHDLAPSAATAFYVGPFAFSGGVLFQDRRDQVVAGRRFTASLPGGPAFTMLNIGHYSAGTVALAGEQAAATGRVCLATGGPDGCSVELGSVAADSIVATTPAGTTLGGWDHGLYVIAFPPEETA